MQFERGKDKLCKMSMDIRHMTKSWRSFVCKGRTAMKSICHLRKLISDAENRLNNLTNERGLRTGDKQIRVLNERLANPMATMKMILNKLLIIRDKTCQYLSITRMCMDDEILCNYEITPNIRTPQLLEILEFLRSRFDPEWEVKEMVVLALDNIGSAEDMDMLMDAWGNCRHAGGEEFSQKLNEYLDALMGNH
ncbi:uncharacterized protein [Drosophila pseudoobscura]|uniref:Uncharacterized protein n=1 Tax=Drosophila pseudoobscura pseudoobscura TaxID=46245 RepID=A0A6I8UCC6_DROPS|nr:uncharacterized protein LOC4813650 [Drosophila pseudoobscura]